MIKIDGSHSEGGGQLLRTALGLSSITGQPFEMINVRKNRPNPGLRPQHVSCVKAAAELCNGKFEGAEVSSSEVKFHPGSVKSRTLSVDIGTAGSVTLLLQSLLLPAVFGDRKFRIKVTGGTDVPFSPTSAYFSEVLLPHLRKFCDVIEYGVSRSGFVPAGGGKAELCVKPKFRLSEYGSFDKLLKDLRNKRHTETTFLSPGKLVSIKGVSVASRSLEKAEVAERQADSVRFALGKLSVPVNITRSYPDSQSPGSAITLRAVFSEPDEVSQLNPVILGSSMLGRRGMRAEDVGKQAASGLMKEISSGAPVDRHLADQLLPFLALTGGQMRVSEITPHCIANVYAIESFLGRCFEVVHSENLIKVRL